ncbi:MAG: BlaI/MecI/CopY family transcriptional regulator [Bacteroidota bacterium]
MSQFLLQNLSRRERQIMELFFQKGALTANEVTELLPDQPSNATVRTLLRILEDKGQLRHKKQGRQFVYSTVVQQGNMGQSVFKNLLNTFFKGSLTDAVATFINDPDTDMSAEELEELEELVKAAKRK